MDAWNMFAELCRTVCENENVYLDVLVCDGMIEFMLMPIEEDSEDD